METDAKLQLANFVSARLLFFVGTTILFFTSFFTSIISAKCVVKSRRRTLKMLRITFVELEMPARAY